VKVYVWCDRLLGLLVRPPREVNKNDFAVDLYVNGRSLGRIHHMAIGDRIEFVEPAEVNQWQDGSW